MNTNMNGTDTYKDKYNASLETARHYHDEMGEDIRVVLEECFQELKESDDERIRKLLVELFNNADQHNYNMGVGVSNKEILAWLEKQKTMTTHEYEQGREDTLWCIKQAMRHAKDENEMGMGWFAEKWVEKQSEQMKNPTTHTLQESSPEPKEIDDERIRKELIGYFTGWRDGEKFRGLPVDSILAWLEKHDKLMEEKAKAYDAIMNKLAIISQTSDIVRIDEIYPKFKTEWMYQER